MYSITTTTVCFKSTDGSGCSVTTISHLQVPIGVSTGNASIAVIVLLQTIAICTRLTSVVIASVRTREASG